MSFFDLIRAMFGLRTSDRADESDRTDVDAGDAAGPSDPDPDPDSDSDSGLDSTDSEHETAAAETDAAAAAGTDAAAAAGTDATASTDSMTQPARDADAAAEPAEAGAGVTEHSGTDAAAAEPAEATGPVPDDPDPTSIDEGSPSAPEKPGADGTDSVSDSDSGSDSDPDPDPDPVDAISGIGSAYAERLATADVETVGDLLAADAGALAERTGISEKRITRWQETAADR